ncbi:MAG: twin-arginine translocase TatA/TatE family subunit [Actinobacteria bacterium]|jgi:TatA/E family protein of Tat protein translocase|nr:twin-arginine translocase TatA/TatE family subunit [Actinomycetota bacterium]
MPRGQELIIILIVIAVLFGAKRLPDSARSLGRSLRIFKSEMKEMKDDDKKDDDSSTK